MARSKKAQDTKGRGTVSKGMEPTWPAREHGQHAVTELVADRQGSLSPYGDVTFPLPRTPYEHPETVINR